MGKDEETFNQNPTHAIPGGKEQRFVKELLAELKLHPIAKEQLVTRLQTQGHLSIILHNIA